MTRTANIFTDPLAITSPYSWPINHDSMDPSGRKRSTTATAPTSGIGAVIQQGTETPLSLTLKGTILEESQRAAFIFWWGLCRTQTIIFTEFSGEVYEGIITNYEETKMPTLRNMRDPSIPFHYYTYTFEFLVVGATSGSWTQVVSV